MRGLSYLILTFSNKLGAIFHADDEEAEIAFRHAVLRENMYNSFEFTPIIKKIDSYDSFEAERIGNFLDKTNYGDPSPPPH